MASFHLLPSVPLLTGLLAAGPTCSWLRSLGSSRLWRRGFEFLRPGTIISLPARDFRVVVDPLLAADVVILESLLALVEFRNVHSRTGGSWEPGV